MTLSDDPQTLAIQKDVLVQLFNEMTDEIHNKPTPPERIDGLLHARSVIESYLGTSIGKVKWR